MMLIVHLVEVVVVFEGRLVGDCFLSLITVVHEVLGMKRFLKREHERPIISPSLLSSQPAGKKDRIRTATYYTTPP